MSTDILNNLEEPNGGDLGTRFEIPKSQSNKKLPYNPISRHYHEVFGGKVYKIPVTTATTCPNREGLRGMKTCNFCDVWGSAAYPDLQNQDLYSQIEESKKRVLSRVNAESFLVYFQAYTTTFARVDRLRESIQTALSVPKIRGIVIGTRPDCISDSFLEMVNNFSIQTYVALELGVQSFDEQQLLWMRRGHTAEKSIRALNKLNEVCPRINLGIHLMLGLPNESDADVISAAKKCNDLPVRNVKLHNLHVLKNTPLADDHASGEFIPIELEEYARRVMIFLQHLNPEISVHRLAALASRSDELIAPLWTTKKMATYQYILDYMNKRNAVQGEFLKNN